MTGFIAQIIAILIMSALQAGAVLANEKEQQTIIDQKIKLETLSVVKDVAQLVEDVAYPEVSRLKIYVSHGVGKYFSLNKATVILDGVDKASSEYNSIQRQALLRGGSHRLYVASATTGIHELVVVFEGSDRGGNIIKNARTWLIDKKPGEMIIKLMVKDNDSTIRPDFEMTIVKGGE